MHALPTGRPLAAPKSPSCAPSNLAARVDARRLDNGTRYLTSVEGGAAYQDGARQVSLSGGMLLCPTYGATSKRSGIDRASGKACTCGNTPSQARRLYEMNT